MPKSHGTSMFRRAGAGPRLSLLATLVMLVLALIIGPGAGQDIPAPAPWITMLTDHDLFVLAMRFTERESQHAPPSRDRDS